MAGHREEEEGREHAELRRKLFREMRKLGEDALPFLKLYQTVKADLAAIKKPYDRRDYADLDEARQDKVWDAEMMLYVAVTASFSATRDRDVRGMMERLDIVPTEDTLLDGPLRRMQELAQAYAESGLAPDEASAKRMADAFKDSLVQFCRDRSSQRGNLIR